jgi:hypothetical protein
MALIKILNDTFITVSGCDDDDDGNNNNNNNNNNNKLQMGCRPVAVVIMLVHEYEIRI